MREASEGEMNMSKAERFFALMAFAMLAVGFAGAFSGLPQVLELGVGGAIFSALISVLVGDRQQLRGIE